MIFGISTPGLILGQTKFMPTAKAGVGSKMGHAAAVEIVKFMFKVGAAVATPLLGYKYLTESGLIEKGAEQFGRGYGTGLPKAYYAAQVETMPLMKELEAQTYVAQQPSYRTEKAKSTIADAQTTARMYVEHAPMYREQEQIAIIEEAILRQMLKNIREGST